MHAIRRIPGEGRLPAFAIVILAVLLFAPSPASASTLLAPTLSATAGNRQVTLSWTAGTSADHFQYRVSYDSGSNWQDWVGIGMPSGDTKQYSVTGLTNGDAYTFQVRAGKTRQSLVSGTITEYSDPSNSVTATPTASTSE